MVRDDISIDWKISPRIITVAIPSTVVTCQDLYDTVKALENTPAAMPRRCIVSAGGKETLREGLLNGITVTMSNAKVAFAARPGPDVVQCNVTAGNLVAVDENGILMKAIQPTAFTQVVVELSTSAALLSDTSESPWTELIEAGYTARDIVRLMAAVLLGDATGLTGPHVVFKSLDKSKTRLAATATDGNRTVTARDPT
jgi:hypothetical protein